MDIENKYNKLKSAKLTMTLNLEGEEVSMVTDLNSMLDIESVLDMDPLKIMLSKSLEELNTKFDK